MLADLPQNLPRQMQLSQNRHEHMEPPAQMRREERITAHAHIERPVARLVEAVRGVAVRGVDCHAVAAGLEGEGKVDDEAFGAADAEVGVDYCYVRHLS